MNFPPVEGVPVLRHVSPEEGPVLEDVVHLVLDLVHTAAASGARFNRKYFSLNFWLEKWLEIQI